jgi:hypothetical protein
MLRLLKPVHQHVKPRIARQDDLAAAVQAHNPRWPVERAEHDHDAAVLA